MEETLSTWNQQKLDGNKDSGKVTKEGKKCPFFCGYGSLLLLVPKLEKE